MATNEEKNYIDVSHQGTRLELSVTVRNIPAIQLFFDKKASEN
jgi:hypothetical protein